MTFQDIVDQQIADLIAVERHIFALIVAQFDRKAVSVRIGSHQQFRIDAAAKFLRELKGFRIFRVRITDGREVRIRVSLLWHQVIIPEASFIHHRHKRHSAAAIERCIDHRNIQVEFILPFMDR